ncbi:tRNA (guanosine(37)-N1)-methyltransferase TrmD [Salsuginibacillus kocurii]|uniref:tRNA (guanosine(37)-N1)-methyltransferase TrmD n=1 Tax=Salsuginibacillus kocurii TaxID=427078 RepID=UPI000366A602|nr:tRNA (guanosine(37)-N1)-methyltransferase TrmD [Salsuginibacillus kocurii]
MKMRFLTLFPEMFSGVFQASIMQQAASRGHVSYEVTNFRDYSKNKHGKVDDYPYGGGAGMVLTPQPLFDAVEDVKEKASARVILLCPQGEPFRQEKAETLAQEEELIFICGHYEGFDERIRSELVTDEISLGDFVLTGGELPAMVVADSVTRLLPGVLGNDQSAAGDSFAEETKRLEFPQYTRPAEFRGHQVPEVLLSGHHRRIEKWRNKQAFLRTVTRRPDLIDEDALSDEEREWLKENERNL